MTDRPQALEPEALDRLFRKARTYNAFSGEVADETLHQLYDNPKPARDASFS